MEERKQELLLKEVMGAIASRVDELYPSPRLESAPILTRRTPLGKQKEAIDALYTAYRSAGGGKLPQRGVYILSGKEGEGIGVGKTYISIAVTAALLHPQGRVLVFCPPHLVPKWRAEVEADGFRAIEVRKVRELLELLETAPQGVEYILVSRDRAKRLPEKRSAPWKRRSGLYCPDCGAPLSDVKERCPTCAAPLFQEEGEITFARALLHHIGRFQFAILDEAHQYRGKTQQGLFATRLAQKLPLLLISGTLMGGYASDIYRILRMAEPALLGDVNEGAFVKTYGATTTVTRHFVYPDGREAQKKTVREAPGFAPSLIPLMLGRSYFIGLSDVEGLPPYKERVHVLTPSPSHHAYLGEIHAVAEAVFSGKENRHGKPEEKVPTYLGPLLMAAYLGMDVPGIPGVVAGKEFYPLTRPISPKELSPKETALLSLVRLSRAKGEKVLVFTEGTGVWDVQGRLAEILTDDGHRPFVLTAEVPPEKRYELLAKAPDILIVNPRLVETGLDLVEYSVGIFYQIPLSAFTLRQAARRIYRLGQKKRVSLYYLAYEGVQESYLSWIAEKVRQSLLFEGTYTASHFGDFLDKDPLQVLAEAFFGQVRRYKGEGVMAPSSPQTPAPSPSAVVLPTLQEDRVVRVGRRKVVLRAGQPILF